VREEGVVLEHDAHVPSMGGNRQQGPSREADLAGARSLETRDELKERRLAAAARAQKGEDLARFDDEACLVDGLDGAEALSDARIR
jgi:hypothetical protein